MKKSLLLFFALLMAVTAQAFPFVTTPSPTKMPIHWYNLKINGRYVYYTPDQFPDCIYLASTASTDDTHLWCFVKTSSGKVLVYNKSAKKYLEMADYVDSDENNSYLSYAQEYEYDDNIFNICYFHAGDNRKYYLYEDADYNFLLSVGGRITTTFFSVEEVLVEGDEGPAGDVNGDGEVTVGDVSAIYDVILGVDNTFEASADVNHDGEVTVGDVSAIYDIILGV